MKVNKLWAALLATTFGLAATMSPTIVEAQGKKKKTEAPAAPVGPAATKKPIDLGLPGVSWGQSVKQVSTAIDKILDEDYKPIYQKTSPGVRMKQLDAQLQEEKDAFRRSRIDFGKLPTGIDATPLRGEYSYLNKESMLTLVRKGETKYFFFIQDKLWKVITEVKLAEGGPLGKNLQEAAVKMSTTFGAPGRVIPPNEDKGIFVTTVDWKDATTHVRLIERSETAVAVAYEENATLSNLDTLRANKQQQEDDIDPAVKAAIRGEEPPPGPPPQAAPDAKKKK